MRFTEFSEFSYAYAVTDNLINGGLLPGIKGAPIFPSLYAEGKKGGGYDVEIPKRGAPLFLQYKIPQIVTRTSKNTPAGFDPPYYRIHLRQGNHSSQHLNLYMHERSGRLVYYAAPNFHTTLDLNSGFDKKMVPKESIFVRPSLIGLLDDAPHHVAYHPGSSIGWVFSEPHQIEGSITRERFFRDIETAIDAAPLQIEDGEFFEGLATEIFTSLKKARMQTEQVASEPKQYGQDIESTPRLFIEQELPRVSFEQREDEARNRYYQIRDQFGPIYATGYIARFYLDCQLLIVGRD
ncbi:MAG: hypothetical protein KC643_24485 [Nitrospira sp.]|nr:hypothetical protein [Nitrospira sp.]